MTKKVNTWWNSKSTIKSPCMDCKDRVVGCHGSCERYSEYQIVIKDYNEEERLRRTQRKGAFR